MLYATRRRGLRHDRSTGGSLPVRARAHALQAEVAAQAALKRRTSYWEGWGHALPVTALADRVCCERRPDPESRSGRLMALFCCTRIAGPHPHEAYPGWSRRPRKPIGSSKDFSPLTASRHEKAVLGDSLAH